MCGRCAVGFAGHVWKSWRLRGVIDAASRSGKDWGWSRLHGQETFRSSKFQLTFRTNICTINGMSSASTIALETALNEAVGRLNVAHADVVAVIAQVLESGCWNGHGIRSAEHWVTWKAGVSSARAHDLVLIARRLNELPVTAAAFSNGLLSVDQTVVIAAETPAEFEESVCTLATSTTVTQLRSALRTYPWHSKTKAKATTDSDNPDSGKPESSEPNSSGTESSQPVPRNPEPVESDRVYTRHDDNGRFHLHAELGTLAGAEIEAALNEAKDALYRAGNQDVTWADALLEVCRRSLNNAGSTSRSDNYRVYLHIDSDRAWINGGPKLPASVRSQILCDSSVHPYLITNGKPINVGRVTRTISPHTRRAIIDRDATCRYPGCSTRKLEVHHLVHWEHGGRTDTNNLAGLCSYHHHRHHDGTYTVSGNADDPGGLTFKRADGTIIHPSAQPVQPTGPLRAPPNPYGHPTGETLQRKWIIFTPSQKQSEKQPDLVAA